jgi:hypothetical protein
MLVYKCRPKQRSTFSGGRGSRKELKPFGEWLDRQRKQFNNPLSERPGALGQAVKAAQKKPEALPG